MQTNGHHAAATDRRPLHIAMVHLSDFHFDSRIQRQAMALADRGDVVELVCLGRHEELRVGEGLIRVHPIPGSKPAGGARGYLRGYARFFLAAARRLTVLERERRFDLVEVHNMPDALTFTAMLPKLHGAPVILNLHDTFPELFASKFQRPHDGLGVRIIELEERISAGFADALITITDEARTRLGERGVGVGRTHIVMNSPDEAIFGPPRAPKPLPSEGPIRVLYHGGTAPRFGVETLIRAFGLLPASAARVELRVCGPGEDVPRLRALAHQIAPERIDVAGAVPFETIPSELEQAHIGVVPTLHDPFTELLLPVKLMEYIHMGLPAVASRLPGIGGYFSDAELRPFEPGSPADLAAAIEDVYVRPDAALERAARATVRLQEIAWEHQRERYLTLIDGLVAGRGKLAINGTATTQVAEPERRFFSRADRAPAVRPTDQPAAEVQA